MLQQTLADGKSSPEFDAGENTPPEDTSPPPIEKSELVITKAESVKFITDKTWSIYESLARRRRLSFYYLFSTLIIYFLVLIDFIFGTGDYSLHSQIKIPLFSVELELLNALLFSPVIIAVVTVNYLYLCAHSYIAAVNYLNHFSQHHHSPYSIRETFQNLKKRDLTHYLNIFFPISWILNPQEKGIPTKKKIMKWAERRVIRFLRIALVASPYLAYLAIIIYLMGAEGTINYKIDNFSQDSVVMDKYHLETVKLGDMVFKDLRIEEVEAKTIAIKQIQGLSMLSQGKRTLLIIFYGIFTFFFFLILLFLRGRTKESTEILDDLK